MRAPTLGPLPETLSLPASSSWQHTALCVHRLPEGHRTFTSWLKAKMRLSPWMPPNKHTPQAVRDANVSGAITTHSACIGWQEGSTKEGACHACTAPFGRNSRHPHCTLYGPCIVLCFLKPCPVHRPRGIAWTVSVYPKQCCCFSAGTLLGVYFSRGVQIGTRVITQKTYAADT